MRAKKHKSKPRVLLCPPTYFEVRGITNPYMKDAPPVDHAKALAQWDALRRAFDDAGFVTHTIDPVPNLEDMVFTANQIFVGHSPKHGKFAVPSQMRFASRRLEVPYFVEWFRARGYQIIDLDLGDEFLEGHGDLLWDADGSRIWAGYGYRSSRGGVEKFADAMRQVEIPVTPLQLVDPYFYHLDTCFSPLKPGAVMIHPGGFSPAALATIRGAFPRIYEIDREDGLGFACNGTVANGRFIISHLTECVAAALKKEGLTPVVVDTSEFEKSGGSVFCMKLFFD
ncbi:MAG TPA: arginine deiminase-related protein [Terriglobales bacterium]|nr:arginine deiminase-related protein [Terriglobales bacterium]